MACGSCGPKPTVPWVRIGLPTIYAWGPFPDHEVVDYAEIDNGNLQQQE